MDASYHRHDISDQVWSLLEPHLPGQRGQWGGIAQENRRFINAVFWVLRTGAPWRDLPPDYGKWGSVHQRFIRWRRKGVWEKLLEILIDEPDYEWLMIDASHIKVHPQAAGAKGGNQDMTRTKGGSTPKYIWPWMRMVCQSKYLITEGTRADCKEAVHLTEGIAAKILLADRVYTLFHGLYRSGRSRHGIPVFSQYNIPLSIIQLSFPGLPPCFGFSGGNRSFTFFHCSSVISCRFILLFYHLFEDTL